MSYQDKMRDGIGYIQVSPGRGPYDLKIVNVTSKPPRSLGHGCVVIKVKFKVPAKAFLPLEPVATLTVPDDFLTRSEDIAVVAEDANEDRHEA